MENPQAQSVPTGIANPQVQQSIKAATGFLLFSTSLLTGIDWLGMLGMFIMLHAVRTIFDNHARGIK